MKRLFLLTALVATAALAASTYTTNYSLEKPADGDVNWGSSYRSNLDTIDTQLFTNSSSVSDHIADTTAAHAATAISSAGGPSFCSSSDDVEEYLDCLATQMAALSGVSGDVMLLATTQTATGAKTFSSGTTRFGSGSSLIDLSTNTLATLPSGTAVLTSIYKSGATNDGLGIYTENRTLSTGAIYLNTGNSSAGASGEIRIQTGTAGTTRNNITLDGGSVHLTHLTTAGPVLTDASGVITSEALLDTSRGGTNKNLTVVNGGIAWTDANSLEVSAAGSSGQILRSGGAAAPTWSTATFPTTGSAAGQTIIVDGGGVNFVAGSLDLADSDAVGSSILPVANGGSNKNMTVVNGGVLWTDSNSYEVTAAGTDNHYLRATGASAPAFELGPTLAAAGYFGAANCSPTRTNTAVGAFGADTDCGAPTSDYTNANFTLASTDADALRVTLTSAPAGVYKVTFALDCHGMNAELGGVAVSDGTTTRQPLLTAGTSGTDAKTFTIFGVFSYGSSGTRNFELYGKQNGGLTIECFATNTRPANWSIEYWPE